MCPKLLLITHSTSVVRDKNNLLKPTDAECELELGQKRLEILVSLPSFRPF